MNGVKQEAKVLIRNDSNVFSCCSGKYFAYQFYGDCSIKNTKSLPNERSFNFFEQGKCDKMYNTMANVGYLFEKNCLYKVGFYSKCNNSDIKLPVCNGLLCSQLY